MPSSPALGRPSHPCKKHLLSAYLTLRRALNKAEPSSQAGSRPADEPQAVQPLTSHILNRKRKCRVARHERIQQAGFTHCPAESSLWTITFSPVNGPAREVAQLCARTCVITTRGITQVSNELWVTCPAQGGAEMQTQAVWLRALPSRRSQPPRHQFQATWAGLPRDGARSSQRDPDCPGWQGQTDILEQQTRSTIPCSSPERTELEGPALQAKVTTWPRRGLQPVPGSEQLVRVNSGGGAGGGSPGPFQEEENILAHVFLKLCAAVGLARELAFL